MNYNKYREAIHEKVCKRCIELAEDGVCGLTGHDQCGVELHLPDIVKVVQSVKSLQLKDYVEELRKVVCGKCKNKNMDGTCQLRSDADCGLDRYFELVVEAIEEVDGKHGFKKKKR